jgi:predicted histone-like DNA-binding protein
MNLRELGRYISERTSISGLDVGFVIEVLLEYIPVLLLEGHSISPGDFGTFSLSLTSKPSDSPENVTAADIVKVNVQFRPGPEFKRALLNAKFEKTV